MSNSKIKTIVFDLGGVYFESGTKIALKKIYKLINAPKEKINEIFEAYPHKEGFLYRRGKLTRKEFWKKAIKKLKINKKLIPQLQEVWHSSYKPIKGMKGLVYNLRKNYKVIVFSGNVRERIEYLNRKYKLKNDFDDFIFSFNVKYNKKELEFYKILLKRIKCKPNEAIFIDDQKVFLNIARKFGLKTIHFKNPKQLKYDLIKIGINL